MLIFFKVMRSSSNILYRCPARCPARCTDQGQLRLLSLFGVVIVVTLLAGFHRQVSTVNLPMCTNSVDAPTLFEAPVSEERLTSRVTWLSRGCTSPTPELWNAQYKEDKLLHQLLYRNGVCSGTFVELGALDGINKSITKAYEDSLQWGGLLIEALPESAAKLKVNRPHVHTVHSATCFDNQTTVKFVNQKGAHGGIGIGGVVNSMSKEHARSWNIDTSKYVEVPCAPLGKLLQGAGLTTVDMFVLDVESGEYEVLRTMDWRVPVGVWLIELDGKNRVKDANVRALLKQHHYVEVRVKGMNKINAVFLHPGYKAHLEALRMS